MISETNKIFALLASMLYVCSNIFKLRSVSIHFQLSGETDE